MPLDPLCPKCTARAEREHRIYSVETEDGEWWFDVEKALGLVAAAPRRPTRIPPPLDGWLLETNQFDEAHLTHIDDCLDDPILVVTVGHAPLGQGGRLGLVDGTHRLKRRLDAGLPAIAYLLTPEETDACVLTVDQVKLILQAQAAELLARLGQKEE